MGLTNAGSAAIVIDFMVESPEIATRALEIMRTEHNNLIGSTCGKNSFIPFIVKHVEI